ncbi:class I SAM-dependent methyltransferase [Protofrankia symbiont of Coriaria ruscifolia]|uniref:class I SAM-dependent methyltransferase n=1 Tax=Protofrankia symbiont of Coriaria ruscifolia TaxID=1306542 RepID=UPI001041399F|nr:class I SAM-dependent methyltransferase [Protofrankia symbiont of Coriaria ruscifolia]
MSVESVGQAQIRAQVAAVPVETCRSCGGLPPRPFLSLGRTPIANRLLRPDDLTEPEPVFPLEVGFCEFCALVQLTHALPVEEIFDAGYPYFSSFSDTLCRHADKHVRDLIASRNLGPDSLVVEIASNDGYLLRAFVERGIPVLGIEPSPGPASAAREIGVPTLAEFFDAELARSLVAQGLRADVIIANNVLAHVPDLNSFVEGMSVLLADDGIVEVENPGVGALLDHTEFDTVYHEHFCYFSTIAVDALMRRHGLYLTGVEEFPELHGGTLRWRLSQAETPNPRVREYLDSERAAGLDTFDRYASFADDVRELQDELLNLLRELRAHGRSVAAYGAAAKGATLLNSSGITTDLVQYVVDRNVHKQGKYIPGARTPILDPAVLVQRQPHYLLLLAWNVRDEIMDQQAAFARRGGKFIVPVPRPVVC